MFELLKKLYQHNKKSKVRHTLLRISVAIFFVVSMGRVLDYVINDIIFNTPTNRYSPPPEGYSSLVLDNTLFSV